MPQKESSNRVTHNWGFYHFIFWLTVTLSLIFDLLPFYEFDKFVYFSSVLIRIVLLLILVYSNLFFFRHFFKKERYAVYAILLFGSMIAFSLVYENIYLMSDTLLQQMENRIVTFSLASNFFTASRYVVLSILLMFIQDWFEQEKKLNEVVINNLRIELNYLRSQINPHFLFNTLNNLYGLALQKSDLTPKIILKLSDMMEYMLLENESNKVPLSKEVDNIHNYMAIEKIRQHNDHRISFEVEGNVSSCSIAPFLLFPLIENGFKHGINANPGAGYLQAHLNIKNDELVFSVENSRGVNQKEKIGNHGIGLTNLKRRLELMYTSRYDLKFNEDAKKYHVTLKLQI